MCIVSSVELCLVFILGWSTYKKNGGGVYWNFLTLKGYHEV